MDNVTKKTVAILSVLMMIAMPLAVIDDYADCQDAGSNVVSDGGEDYTDAVWTDVKSETELRNAIGNQNITLIRLSAGITLNDSLEISRDIILNLNKKTLGTNFSTAHEYAVKIIGSSVTIEYGTVSASGCAAIEIASGGCLTLVTADVGQTGGTGDNASAIIVNGSLTVDASYSAGITGNVHAVLINSGEVTINGGTFNSSGTSIYQKNTTQKTVLTINGGNFSGTTYALCTEGGSDSELTINSGKFNASVDATGTALAIWGGQFEKKIIQGVLGHDCFIIHGGVFKNDIPTTPILDSDSDVTDVELIISLDPYTTESAKYVYQKESIKVKDKEGYYATIADALSDPNVSTLDTIEFLKKGTYIFNIAEISKSTKYVGMADGIIIDAYNTPQYASGQNIYMENVTIKRANEAYLGFRQCTSERYVNVTFTTLFNTWGYSTAEFTGCTFMQPDINSYSVQVYGSPATTFTDCTFVSGGKSVLIYNEGEFTGRTVTFNNCTFIDKCFAKDKAAVEIHTEYGTIVDRSGWDVYFNGCTVSGFYNETLCESNLWNAVNNTDPQSLSKWSKIYIDGYEEYPNPAVYEVELMDGETLIQTVSAKYGKTMSDVTVPEQSGYVFNGYYNSVTNIQYFDKDGKCVRAWDARAGGELYALWTENIKHKVTYSANGASGNVPTQADVQEGARFNLAYATGLSLTDYGFVGWSDGYKTYAAGSTIIMGASDMSFSAVWSKNYNPPQPETPKNVSLTILDSNGNTVSAVSVSVDGKDAGITDLDGEITVGMTKGTHMVNISAEPSLNQTKTVVVGDETASETITLTDYRIKTVVDTEYSDADIAVDNLDKVAESFKEEGDQNVTVTVKVDNSTVAISNAESDISETKNLAERSDCVFYDVSIFVDKGTGAEKVTEITETLEIIIPIDTSLMKVIDDKSFIVYHCHENSEGKTVYTEIVKNETEHKPFTYYVADGNIHIFLKQFSGITINYTPLGSVSVTYDVGGGSESAPVQSSVVENGSFKVKAYAGEKEGFEFGGWSYNGTVYKEGETINVTTSDVKLVAVWNPIDGPEKKEVDIGWTVAFIVLLAILEYAAIFYFGFRRKDE